MIIISADLMVFKQQYGMDTSQAHMQHAEQHAACAFMLIKTKSILKVIILSLQRQDYWTTSIQLSFLWV